MSSEIAHLARSVALESALLSLLIEQQDAQPNLRIVGVSASLERDYSGVVLDVAYTNEDGLPVAGEGGL